MFWSTEDNSSIQDAYKMLSVAVSRTKLLNHSCFSLNLAIYHEKNHESHWNCVYSVLILLSVVDES